MFVNTKIKYLRIFYFQNINFENFKFFNQTMYILRLHCERNEVHGEGMGTREYLGGIGIGYKKMQKAFKQLRRGGKFK